MQKGGRDPVAVVVNVWRIMYGDAACHEALARAAKDHEPSDTWRQVVEVLCNGDQKDRTTR